jgi:hypothetical protein
MSYDLALYFRSLRFPDREWTEILSWFDAIERAIEPEKFGHTPYLGKEWFIQVDGYGIFCTVYERHPPISSRIKRLTGRLRLVLGVASACVSFSATRSATVP